MASNLETPEEKKQPKKAPSKPEDASFLWVKWSQLLALIAAFITILATFAGVFNNYIAERVMVPDLKLESRFESLDVKIKALDDGLVKLRAQTENLSLLPEQSKVAIQLKGIDAAVKDLQTRHSELEQAILANPGKAIEVPLLRKDLDNLKDAQQQNALALKQGVDQVYDLNKWLLGAMAVSIVTLAVSNLLRGTEKKSE